jgi:hypothetical protein
MYVIREVVHCRPRKVRQMVNESLRRAMADYYDLLSDGRREIDRIES